MIKSRNHFLLVLVVGVCLCFAAMLMASPLAAQSTYGSVTGTITDASGSAVPDATVTLTSSTTDFTHRRPLPARSCIAVEAAIAPRRCAGQAGRR